MRLILLSLILAAAAGAQSPSAILQPPPALPPLQTIQQLPPDDLALARSAATRGDAPEALSRYLHVLAVHPDDVDALAGAGQAALAVGDYNAASAFFGRAEARAPNNAGVKAGIASTLVRQGDARGALRYFRAAVALGIPEAAIAGDRGLAYDLRGEYRRAQAEYGLVLRANPADAGTIKRLALSQAIGGEPAAALATLDPLLRRQDVSAWRTRMFARALAGDVAGADADAALVLNAQQAASLSPYLARLAGLKPADKAAAVFLGRFPTAPRPAAVAAAVAPMPAPRPAVAPAAPVAAPLPAPKPAASTPPALVDLGPPARPAASPVPVPPPVPAAPSRRERLAQARAEAAEARRREIAEAAAAQKKQAAKNPRRYWAQIAGGANKRDLPKAWAALKGRHGADLAGHSPWTMHYRYTNRLMIGPFASAAAAQAWVNEKRAKGMATFMVTTEAGTEVEPIG